MSEEQSDYRPRSPDLSAFAPPPAITRLPSYHAPEPGLPPGYSFSPRGSYDASPYFSPQTQSASSYFGSHFPPTSFQSPSSQSARTPSLPSTAQYAPTQFYGGAPPQLTHPQTRIAPPQPPAFNAPNYHSSPHHSTFSHEQPPYPSQTYPEMARTRQKKSADDFDTDYDPNNSAPSRTAMPKMEQAPATMPEPYGATHNVDVKTKFPVARIKRIMQADEDVGKVAQATPTAVAKALELFMIALVAKGATEARSQNSKRVTAQHLKAALMKDGQFDFLADACADVPDEASKKGRAKSEAKSEESDEELGGNGGARKKSKTKKRKADSDDDSG